MHRATWLTIFACTFGLSLSASLPAGESNQVPPDLSGKTQQAFCWSSHNEYREPAIYFSDVFEIRIPKNAGRWYSIDMAKVFAAHLTGKHGYVSPVPLDRPSEMLLHANIACALHDTAQTARGSKDLLIEQHRYYKQPVVETGWKMSAQHAEAAANAAAAKPASPAPAAPQSPSMSYGYCICSYGEYRYYSAAFSSPADQYTHWRQAFLKSLKERYNVQGYIQCARYASQAESQKDFDNIIRLARAGPPDRNVETDWAYAAATPVAAAPTAPPEPATTTATRPPTAPAPVAARIPAPAPAAVSSIHAVCWADFDQATRYYSAVFSGAGSDYGDWMPTFKQFLQRKYKYQGSVRCTKQPDKAKAQKYWDEMVGNALGILLPGGGTPKIIETGWTYKRPG